MAAAECWKQRLLPPPLMEEENDYRPKVVSIGPIFHGGEDLALVENFKPTAVDLFVAGEENREFYLGKILEIIDEIQSFHEQKSTPKEQLAEMMLRDASLIIIYMEIIARDEVDSSTTTTKRTTQHKFSKMKEHLGMLTVAILARDLFLLQNQIPLSVIKLLIYLRYGPTSKVEELLDRFLNKIFREENRQKRIFSVKKEVNRREPLHLLEASHMLIVSDFVRPASPNAEMEINKPFHSFRTVTDLVAKGIRFQPIPNQSSESVSFKSYFFFATIQLPSWAITIHTKVLLKNMVAYELSPGSPTEGEVLSYINFMKSLIDVPEDVRVLREKRILSNLLSSDEEAAKIYNDINTYGLDNPKFFGQVEHQIQDHCKKRINVWIAELFHSYFRSPWTITAFFAALSVLVISAAQLYYAVHPPPN